MAAQLAAGACELRGLAQPREQEPSTEQSETVYAPLSPSFFAGRRRPGHAILARYIASKEPQHSMRRLQ